MVQLQKKQSINIMNPNISKKTTRDKAGFMQSQNDEKQILKTALYGTDKVAL